jgi:hypothetical protein
MVSIEVVQMTFLPLFSIFLVHNSVLKQNVLVSLAFGFSGRPVKLQS